MSPDQSRQFPSPGLSEPASYCSSDMLNLLSRSMGATVAVVDRNLQVIYANHAYSQWFGETPQSIVGKTLAHLYGEADCARFMPFVERVLGGERLQYQRLLRNPDGVEEWRTICLTPWRNAEDTIGGFVTSALGVHELQVTMNALRVANQRLSSHMDNSPLAVLEMDHALRLLHCSQRAIQLMRWENAGPLVGRSLPEVLEAAVQDERLSQALQRLQTGFEAQNRAETSFVRSDGSEVHCEWFNSALTDATGRVTSIMSLVQDVSARVQIARQQHHLASHDSLTGLYNRSAFYGHLERALEHAQRNAGMVALLFIDLDGFKMVNDQEGHRAGDEVLRIVAQRLASSVREGDTLARLGGDEFLVMLDNDVTEDMPYTIAQRIIEALEQPITVGTSSNVRIGASIGLATHPPIQGDIDLLMSRADQAMYIAKRTGKGRIHHAD